MPTLFSLFPPVHNSAIRVEITRQSSSTATCSTRRRTLTMRTPANPVTAPTLPNLAIYCAKIRGGILRSCKSHPFPQPLVLPQILVPFCPLPRNTHILGPTVGPQTHVS